MSSRMTLLISGALITLASAPVAVAQAPNVGRAPTSRPAPQPTPMQPTRLQIEFYAVECAPQRLTDIDMDALTPAAPRDILSKLAAFGEARLLARIDQIGNLPTGLRVTAGKRMPTTQSIVVGPGGKTTPSVSYQEVGATCNLAGDWREDGRVAAVKANIEVSQVVKSPVVIAENVRLPAFESFKLDQQIAFESGKPVLLMASDLATDLQDAQSVVLIVRIRLTNLGKQD